jgi:hypothetical protein
MAGTGSNALAALLGGDTTGLDTYKTNTGFNQELESGLRGITGTAAARGLLRSGSTGKAFMRYGQELEQRTAQNYIQNLLGLSGLGLTAGGVLAGAGNTSTSSGKSKGLQAPFGGWGG